MKFNFFTLLQNNKLISLFIFLAILFVMYLIYLSIKKIKNEKNNSPLVTQRVHKNNMFN